MQRQRLIIGFTYNRLFIFIGLTGEAVNRELTFDVTKLFQYHSSIRNYSILILILNFSLDEYLKNKKFMFKIGIVTDHINTFTGRYDCKTN